MHVISFVTQKGGAGKSTLAFSTAVAAQQDGEVVAVLDLDPQNSTAFWAESRQRSDLYVESLLTSALATRIAELQTAGFTLCVLDAASSDVSLDAAIAASDLCLIPTRPNVFDLRTGAATRAKVAAEGKRGVFVLNQCPPMQKSARVQDGARALEAAGALVSSFVSTRVDFQDAARVGLGVTELNPTGPAAREIRDLWRSVARLLAPEISAELPAADAAPALVDEIAAPPAGTDDDGFAAAA